MIYIPTKLERQKARDFLADLKRQGLPVDEMDLDELLAMYLKVAS